MPKLFLQIRNDNTLAPATPDDLEAMKKFMPNQILKANLTGTLRARSVMQNRWIHVMFKITSQNTDDPEWDTLEKTKRMVKLALKFFKDDVIVSGNKVFFELRSFAFHEMSQVEANRVFNDAKIICAEKIGVSPEELETRFKDQR